MTKPAWAVTEGAAPQRWRIDRTGKHAVFEELTPPDHMRVMEHEGSVKNASFFELEIIAACCVGGEGAEAGDIVKCFGVTALDLRACGRVRVISETRPQ